MALPLFYSKEINNTCSSFELNEETSKHIVQVLRMKTGDQLQLTDGKGYVFNTEIIDDHKKKAAVQILSSSFVNAPIRKITIAISLIKNTARFEWFLEKATEIGVSVIIPLLCARTEKQHFRFERMNGILISAMLQSQQSWLPLLHTPLAYTNLFTDKRAEAGLKMIAHCEEAKQKNVISSLAANDSSIILIGPEGDFTTSEIDLALQQQFCPVSLGETRLRTETAGVVAATLLRNHQ